MRKQKEKKIDCTVERYANLRENAIYWIYGEVSFRGDSGDAIVCKGMEICGMSLHKIIFRRFCRGRQRQGGKWGNKQKLWTLRKW